MDKENFLKTLPKKKLTKNLEKIIDKKNEKNILNE